jgi:hypothetical protein
MLYACLSCFEALPCRKRKTPAGTRATAPGAEQQTEPHTSESHQERAAHITSSNGERMFTTMKHHHCGKQQQPPPNQAPASPTTKKPNDAQVRTRDIRRGRRGLENQAERRRGTCPPLNNERVLPLARGVVARVATTGPPPVTQRCAFARSLRRRDVRARCGGSGSSCAVTDSQAPARAHVPQAEQVQHNEHRRPSPPHAVHCTTRMIASTRAGGCSRGCCSCRPAGPALQLRTGRACATEPRRLGTTKTKRAKCRRCR